MFITTVQNVAHLGVVHIEIWEAAMFIVTEVKTQVTTLVRKAYHRQLQQHVLQHQQAPINGLVAEQQKL